MVPARLGVDARRAAHFAHHDDECRVQQAPLLQILDQRRINLVEQRQVHVFQHAEVVLVHVVGVAVMPEDFLMHANERHARLHQPARHEHAGTEQVFSVTIADFLRLAGQVKCLAQLAGRQQVERPALHPVEAADNRRILRLGERLIQVLQQRPPPVQAVDCHFRERVQRRQQRLTDRQDGIVVFHLGLASERRGTLSEERIILTAQKATVRAAALPSLAPAGIARHTDRAGQVFRSHPQVLADRTNVRRVGRPRLVQKAAIRVPGHERQRVVRIEPVRERADQAGLVHQPGSVRQVLADVHARHRGADGPELTADFIRCVRLHVEHVDVAWSTKQIEHNHGPRLAARPRGLTISRPQQPGQSHASEER